MFEPRMVVDRAARAERIGIIVKYFRDNRGSHGLYFLCFIFCEVLNFVNVIGQMFLMDRFLGYEFSTYGTSGTIETHDALCVLPMNIINEKIYVFIWFWF